MSVTSDFKRFVHLARAPIDAATAEDDLVPASPRGLNEDFNQLSAPDPIDMPDPAAQAGSDATVAFSLALSQDKAGIAKWAKLAEKYAGQTGDEIAIQTGAMTRDEYIRESVARDLREEYEKKVPKLPPVYAALLEMTLQHVDWSSVADEVLQHADIADEDDGGETEGEATEGSEAPAQDFNSESPAEKADAGPEDEESDFDGFDNEEGEDSEESEEEPESEFGSEFDDDEESEES